MTCTCGVSMRGAGIPARPSREAAKDCIPRRKPWVTEGAKEDRADVVSSLFKQSEPQGLKPSSLVAFSGTAEAEPFPKPFCPNGSNFRWLETGL
jgi:hypothetical protein